MTTRRQLLKVKVRIHPSAFVLISSSSRDSQRQRSRRSRYKRNADEMNNVDEYHLGCRRKDNCSYLTGMNPLQKLIRCRGLRSLLDSRFQINGNVC